MRIWKIIVFLLLVTTAIIEVLLRSPVPPTVIIAEPLLPLWRSQQRVGAAILPGGLSSQDKEIPLTMTRPQGDVRRVNEKH